MYGKNKQLILVASDTHGRTENLERLLKAFRFDMLIFCGDGEGLENDLAYLPGCPACIYMVRGNNDYNHELKEDIVFPVGNRKVFVTHGHRYRLYQGLSALSLAAEEKGCDFCIFGHIHRPVCFEESGMIFLNPGSLSEPRQEGHAPTCAILETEEDFIRIRLINALTMEAYQDTEHEGLPAVFQY